jgi:uncharacterized membrane protein
MSSNEIERVIEKHMKKIAKLLPDSFETDDLLEDLRYHIYESFNEKVQRNPEDEKLRLIAEVLEELGTPEEIAEEYGREQVDEDEKKSTADKWIYYTMRIMLTIIVVVLASYVTSIITEGAINFMFAVVVLLAFAVLEWLVRSQQTKDA